MRAEQECLSRVSPSHNWPAYQPTAYYHRPAVASDSRGSPIQKTCLVHSPPSRPVYPPPIAVEVQGTRRRRKDVRTFVRRGCRPGRGGARARARRLRGGGGGGLRGVPQCHCWGERPLPDGFALCGRVEARQGPRGRPGGGGGGRHRRRVQHSASKALEGHTHDHPHRRPHLAGRRGQGPQALRRRGQAQAQDAGEPPGQVGPQGRSGRGALCQGGGSGAGGAQGGAGAARRGHPGGGPGDGARGAGASHRGRGGPDDQGRRAPPHAGRGFLECAQGGRRREGEPRRVRPHLR
mmetsp:Transcript_17317/g.55556  ORF Transcript_17317/g.55556 Transcript_17317/m.55556 type:complete len:293 (-) Transcript_17317:386-1264(-)